jgi:hypothetical protein
MKPAWDKLGDEYKGSKTVIIADVDCTKEQDLCQKYGVSGRASHPSPTPPPLFQSTPTYALFHFLRDELRDELGGVGFH